MQDKNFVFLICSERSGSNLISAIMKAHSKVDAPPPYHLCRDIGLNLHATLGLGANSHAWEQMMGHIVTMIRRQKSDSAARQFLQWLNTKNTSVNFKDILTYVYTELDIVDNAKVIFIKENNLYKMLFFILHYFPQAKFVFQVRDPRDYLASAIARKKVPMGNKFGSNLRAMEIWRADQLGGLTAMAHLGHDKVFFQRYEDLISNPESVLSALCNFLDLDFESKMLEFYKSFDYIRSAKLGGARENITKPLMSDNFGKYRQNLSKEQIFMVEMYLGDLMERFGYSKEFPDEEPTLNSILMPQMSEVVERCVNGETGPFYSDRFNLKDASEPLSFPYEDHLNFAEK